MLRHKLEIEKHKEKVDNVLSVLDEGDHMNVGFVSHLIVFDCNKIEDLVPV
jgi:hypothetical protein